MIRKQVFITEEQERRLKALSEQLGVAQAEIVREGVDLVLDQREMVMDVDAAVDQAFGIWKDREDVEALIQENRERAKDRFPHVYGKGRRRRKNAA